MNEREQLRKALEVCVSALETAESEMRDWHSEHPSRVQMSNAIDDATLALTTPQADKVPAAEGASLPPMTCKHNNRTDCALYDSKRPPPEWYRGKIGQTLDDEFAVTPPAKLPQEAKVRDIGFIYENGNHTPTVLVEFNVADFDARDRFVASLAAPQPARAGAVELAEYAPGQWWLEELEGLFAGRKPTDNTRRAAKVALDFAKLVFATTTAATGKKEGE